MALFVPVQQVASKLHGSASAKGDKRVTGISDRITLTIKTQCTPVGADTLRRYSGSSLTGALVL